MILEFHTRIFKTEIAFVAIHVAEKTNEHLHDIVIVSIINHNFKNKNRLERNGFLLRLVFVCYHLSRCK